MKKVTASVEGASDLVKDLKAMEDAAAQVLLKSAQAGGKIALNAARQNCPVDTGALRNSLRLTDGKATKKKATVQVDYDKSLTYGTHVELGSRGHPANPFLRNAVDDNQESINNAIVKAIGNSVGRKL